jgi:DNA-binding GntR family transcriptional regulator
MKRFETKAEWAYKQILNDISNGHYQPAEKIVIRKLALEYAISEIPIREALKRLESEGFVSATANKSVVVTSMDCAEVDNFFHVKGVLEGYATKTSIDHLSEDDIKELEAINEKMRKAGMAQDTEEFSRLNYQFHMRIYQDNPNKQLIELIKNLWKRWSITKRVFRFAPKRMDHSVAEHQQIVQLIRAKDYDEAERFVRQHKFNAGVEMVARMKGVELERQGKTDAAGTKQKSVVT